MEIKNPFRDIPPRVVFLGCVSFLNDLTSDMIFPLLPLFLTQYLGATAGFMGLMEGAADSAAAFFTLYAGIIADRTKDRSKIVLGGYSLSALSKLFIAAAHAPWVVFIVRFCDRAGKGVRTSPRDALIVDSVPPEMRGKAFGLHRSMDHAGAVAGPLLATFLLSFFIKDLRQLFLIACFPGLLSVVLILWKIRDVLPDQRVFAPQKISLKLPRGRLAIYLCILFLFILSCSTDAFLLMRASDLGVPKAMLPVLWLVLHIVKMMTTFPFGILSDKIGRRRVILMGWCVYILVYAGFAAAREPWHIWALFSIYGLFYGLTEGGERAILADYADPAERGQAFGWYYLVEGLGVLPASLIFGWIWQKSGAPAAFYTSACISTAAAVLLYLFIKIFPSRKISGSLPI